MNEQILFIRSKLQEKLSLARYEHTLSVSFTAMALAMRYRCDLEKAELAGLLHDCAKRFSDAEILEKCKQKHLPISEEEKKAPAVLHAKLGASLAKEKFGVTDSEILNAIRYHTTGRPQMSLLEKIVYVADYIEPRRNKAPNLEELRTLSFVDLDEALYQIMKGTLEYLAQKGGAIDPASKEAFLYYEQEREKRRMNTDAGCK